MAWKEISGTDGAYFVSDAGEVRSIDRYIVCKDGKAKHRKGHVLTGTKNSMGYLRVQIWRNGRKQRCFVHRLVAEAFVDNPNSLPVVNHKDFNPLNNRANNLEWCTERQNYDYSYNRGRYKRTDAWKSNLQDTLVNVMGKPVIGTRVSDGAELHFQSVNATRTVGFQPSCVSNCCQGKRASHKGYAWRFANGK